MSELNLGPDKNPAFFAWQTILLSEAPKLS
jgi:hypothetical protein